MRFIDGFINKVAVYFIADKFCTLALFQNDIYNIITFKIPWYPKKILYTCIMLDFTKIKENYKNEAGESHELKLEKKGKKYELKRFSTAPITLARFLINKRDEFQANTTLSDTAKAHK